jgi:uncharacterized RDD family membrane protein YckC
MAGILLASYLLSLAWAIWECLTGAALGKTLLRIRIKSQSGNPASSQDLVIRACVKYSPSLLSFLGGITNVQLLEKLSGLAWVIIVLGFLLVLGSSRQAVHDMVAKTAVYRD